MKSYLLIAITLLGALEIFSQTPEKPTNVGDNFSLEGALEMLAISASVDKFEEAINDESKFVNNLDLNNDGKIDYISVRELVESDIHVLVLSANLNSKDLQDIAAINIEKTGDQKAHIEIIGDESIYPSNTILSPEELQEELPAPDMNRNGPCASDISIKRVIVNVWFWPSIRNMYVPNYRPWVSPFRWNVYPSYWRPRRPVAFNVFYTNVYPRTPYYRRMSAISLVNSRRFYGPNRRTSTIVVKNRRGTTVIQKGPRGRVKSVQRRRGRRG
jgi:hypothetical protein